MVGARMILRRLSVFVFLATLNMTAEVQAKEVMVCRAWGDLSGMECSTSDKESFTQEASIFKLYNQGWELVSTLPRIENPSNNKSLFIFHRVTASSSQSARKKEK
jgi:hypothetical protein